MWKRSPKRGTIIRVRVDDRRDSSIVLDLQVRKKGVSCRRQPGARSDPLLEVERIKLVWMQRRKGAERCASERLEKRSKGGGSGAAQRGKSAAKWHTVRRTRKHSKRGG